MARTLISTNATVHTPDGTHTGVRFEYRQGRGVARVTDRRASTTLVEGPSPVASIDQPATRTFVVSFAEVDGVAPEPWTVTLQRGCGCGR